jgi:hypothetical protein
MPKTDILITNCPICNANVTLIFTSVTDRDHIVVKPTAEFECEHKDEVGNNESWRQAMQIAYMISAGREVAANNAAN